MCNRVQCHVNVIMEGDRVFEFDDWRNFMVYWKGDLQYKETIKGFLSNSQWKKLRDGIFGNFFRLQSVKFSGKLIHCILLSEIVNNEPDSMTFKVFDREIKFTHDAFHIITGLKSYTLLDIKGLHEKENRLLRVYFPGKDRIELGDFFSFISSHPHGTASSFVGSDDDALKLATIYFVEFVLMGKRKNRNVSDQIMKILFKLIEVSPFIPVEEEDTEPLSVEDPISQDQSSRSSSTQFDEAILKEIVRRLSESFKKDLQAEVTRVYQKIAVAEKKIENEIMDLKKTLGSKLDTLLNIFGKADQMNTDRESSVPIRKDGVDDHCRATEPIVTINEDAGGDERDDMDVDAEVQYESDFRDAHLDDETENVTDIGKESTDGVEVEDVGEFQDRENPKEKGETEKGETEKICKCGLQSQEDLSSPLGTSVSGIVCKCLEGTYDLSTPLSYKEKFGFQSCANQESFEAGREEAGVEYQEKSGIQSQDVQNTEGTSRSEIGSKCINATCDISRPPSLNDDIGTEENASEDNDIIGMILTIANESCEQATEAQGEQLQDDENVQLEEKENDASNILAELSLEKIQEESCEQATEAQGEQLQDDENVQLGEKENDASNILAELSLEKIQEGSVQKTAVSKNTRKRKRDSIGYDGPSFAILSPTPPSTQMSIDGALTMEVEGNIEEELGRGKRYKKLSWQLKSPFDQERKAGTSKSDDQNTPKSSGWIKSTYTRRGQIDVYADDNGVRKNPYKLYHQKISSKMFFLEFSDSSYVLDDKHIDIALYYLRKKECYHPRDHPFRCTTTDILFDNYMVLVYKDFSDDATDDFWCAGDNQLFLTPYVWGDSRRCGIAWTEVDKIFFPCRLPSEEDNAVTHFLLGVLDLNQKKIDVYDSIYSEPYEAGLNHMEMYARMIPHLLKFSQFDKHHKSFGNVFNKFDIQWQRSPRQIGSTDCGAFLIKYVELLMIAKDVEQFKPEDIKDFRRELAANLWAHGEWKRNSGYDTPPENVGDDYESENETCCPKEL
ncbi:hypothetical protein A4A49_34825 [Nicotiana attenuata]|uniref:Ubiquitin-like protease family profile domain-containing protein n=1 Tax=Nicotiana attenuata TaxID=49451 RepID=A0A1J6KTV6_NICAT|nr:hypothetical protein A4A49_34825 [Nicotiana attenuata]